jgi:O-antigen/teichoic acid export membrane protein
MTCIDSPVGRCHTLFTVIGSDSEVLNRTGDLASRLRPTRSLRTTTALPWAGHAAPLCRAPRHSTGVRHTVLHSTMATDDSPPSTRQRRSVAGNALLLLGSQTITWTLSAAVLVILPRLFGVDAVGRIAVAASIWSVAGTVMVFGSSTFVTLESARRPDDIRSIVAQTLRLRVVSVCVTWTLVVGFLVAVRYPSEIVVVVLVIGVISTFDSFVDVGKAGLIGIENMGAVARADIAGRLAATVVVLTVALTTRSLLATLAVGLVTPLVRGSQTVPVLLRLPKRGASVRWSDARGIARRSSPFFLAGIALVLYGQVDTIVMSVLLDEREIGWYGSAILLFTTLLFAPNIVMTSLLPALTREHAREPKAADELLGRAFDTLVLIAVPIGLATTVCAPAGIRLLFGDEFEPAAQVLAVLGFVLLFTFLTILLGSYAYATDRQRFWNIVMLTSIAVSIPLDFVFVPWMERSHGNGAIGGALAYLVTELLMVVAGIAYLVPHLLTSARISRILRCALAGVAMTLTGWPLRDQFVVVPGVVVLGAYVTVVLVLRVPSESEQAQARSVLATVTRGRWGVRDPQLDAAPVDPPGAQAPPTTDWALLTRLLSLREAERTMTPEGWRASGEVGRTVNATPALSRALSTHLGSWVGKLARGAAHDDDDLAPYRTLAVTDANWHQHDHAGASQQTDRRTLLALLVVDAVRLEQLDPTVLRAEHADVTVLARRGELAQQFGRRMVDAGVLGSWEQVAELDENDLTRCLTEPTTIRERFRGA